MYDTPDSPKLRLCHDNYPLARIPCSDYRLLQTRHHDSTHRATNNPFRGLRRVDIEAES